MAAPPIRKKRSVQIAIARGKKPQKEKGRGIGYALADGSYEGVANEESCTITALDVTTAFAVPNPNASSQSASVFSGLVALQVALPSRSLSLLWTGPFIFKPTLSAVDGEQSKRSLDHCQCRSSVQRKISSSSRIVVVNVFSTAGLCNPIFPFAQIFHILFTAVPNRR